MNLREVDRDWFVRLVTAHFGSLRKLSARMTLPNGNPSDGGRLSLLLSGKTEPSVSEVLQLADLLAQDVPEVLKRFGYKIPKARKSSPPPKVEPHANWK